MSNFAFTSKFKNKFKIPTNYQQLIVVKINDQLTARPSERERWRSERSASRAVYRRSRRPNRQVSTVERGPLSSMAIEARMAFSKWNSWAGREASQIVGSKFFSRILLNVRNLNFECLGSWMPDAYFRF